MKILNLEPDNYSPKAKAILSSIGEIHEGPYSRLELINNISKLPWYEDGYLIDPCNAKDMRNEQFVVLSHYIQELINGIQTLSYSNMEVFNAVMGRLQEFKTSCDAKSGGATFSGWTPTKVNLNLPAQPVYDKLATIYVGASDQNAKFDCGLAVRPELADQIKGGIFADFRVAQSKGKTLSDVRVWNNYSLNSLRQDENLYKKLKSECEEQGYLYLTPETIFTEKLVVLPGGDRKLKAELTALRIPFPRVSKIPCESEILNFSTTAGPIASKCSISQIP